MLIKKGDVYTNNPVLAFIKILFRGISQVILIENAISGALITVAIMISSYSLGLITIISSIIGTTVARIGGADKKSIDQGLFGYNSVLTGIALALFLDGSYRWLIALVGAAVASIVTAMMIHIMKNTQIPVLTSPFIIVTWLTLLASYKLNAFKLSSSLVPQDLTHWKLNIAGNINWIEGIFSGIGQVFFLDNTLSGIILFISVFLCNWKYGLIAIIGNAVALCVAYTLEAEHSLILKGLYGYNAILAILAVCIVSNSPLKKYKFLAGIMAAILTVPLAASISILLMPYGLPALTMPFVLSSWLIIGARNTLTRL
ncbi:urea transporter [Priestia sp. SIMBA_032]|uniref:urea transporter n=1 Tax=Priestia sp. SIMBA_032 TaxID=3085775 RepID=UPI00397D0B4B